jgi:SNF2 family DNA or RNA helicase
VRDAPGRIVAYEGLDLLRARLAGFFLRRERRTVQHQLPPRTENTFWTGMSAAQLRPYRAHAAAAAAILARRAPLGPQDTRALLAALTAMRILCNAHAQYAWRDAARSAEEAPRSPKLEEFARVLEELLEGADSKIVVFSEWERMLRLAHAAARGPLSRLDQRGEVFHGGLSGHQRVALLRAFQEDPDFRVLFSTDAGGVGLNLQVASVVVNLDVPWNPAVLEQRVARVHRMGQRRAVQVLHFVARGTIEERVREVLQEKRALFEGLLSGCDDRVDLGRTPGGASWIDSARLLLAPGGA